jgi:hypothetical protein
VDLYKQVQARTLGGFAAQDATQDTLAITSENLSSYKKCVCGLNYDLWKCCILNLEAKDRPEGYKPNRIGLPKTLRALKNPQILKRAKKLFKDNNIL